MFYNSAFECNKRTLTCCLVLLTLRVVEFHHHDGLCEW